MSKSWFDTKTGHLLFDEHVAVRPSFQKVMADGVVTDSELADQAELVTKLLRRLESELPPDKRDLMHEAFCELAVLNALHTKAREQTVMHR